MGQMDLEDPMSMLLTKQIINSLFQPSNLISKHLSSNIKSTNSLKISRKILTAKMMSFSSNLNSIEYHSSILNSAINFRQSFIDEEKLKRSNNKWLSTWTRSNLSCLQSQGSILKNHKLLWIICRVQEHKQISRQKKYLIFEQI